MTRLFQISLTIFLIATALTLIVGAYRRWAWLVDPPARLWPIYSQALIERLFGSRAVVVFTYGLGVVLLLTAALIIYSARVAK